MTYAKALKKTQCESVRTTIRKLWLLFAGGVQWTNDERLTHRVVFGTMAGAEKPRSGRAGSNWVKRPSDDLCFEPPSDPGKSPLSLFGAEMLWTTAAKKGGK